MKFTVDIEDFWLDSEEDIEKGLKAYVVNTVVQTISRAIEQKVKDAVTLEAQKQVNAALYKKVQKITKQVVATCKMKKEYNSDASMTIEEYIKYKFESDSGYSSPKDQITKLAKQFGDELKRRYDLLFASQIVAKLNENGLLKDEAVKLLLETIETK